MKVNFPELEPLTVENCSRYIIQLYCGLGWHKETNLQPKKVKINTTQWTEICQSFIDLENEISKEDEDFKPANLWLNYGPSASMDVPYGKVVILEGAFGESHELTH